MVWRVVARNREVRMPSRDEKVETFRALHEEGCFVMPNAWDALGARLLTGAGFGALATTSSGYAFSVGKKDGSREVSRDEAFANAASIAAATDLPVSADTEDCYADAPSGIAKTVELAAEAGLAGLSIEDRWPLGPEPFRTFEDAVARVGAAADAARRHDLVLTARADGLGKRAYDLEEVLRRLRAFEAAGADVLYAPGVPDLATLGTLCRSVAKPVNHLLGQGLANATLDDIAETGARRVSLGGSLARVLAANFRELGRTIAAGDFTALQSAPSWSELRGN